MPTMNIYISADLKGRMDAAGTNVNWSAVAQKSFEATLQKQEWETMTDEIEAAAARLRASRALIDVELAEEVGRRWLLKEASYEQGLKLRNLKVAKSFGNDFAVSSSLPKDLSDLLCGNPTALWEQALGSSDLPSSGFARKFVESAQKAFREVFPLI